MVPRAGATPSPDALENHVRERISAFKRPRHVLFVDELPLTGNGKVDKLLVRDFARRTVTGADVTAD